MAARVVSKPLNKSHILKYAIITLGQKIHFCLKIQFGQKVVNSVIWIFYAKNMQLKELKLIVLMKYSKFSRQKSN